MKYRFIFPFVFLLLFLTACASAGAGDAPSTTVSLQTDPVITTSAEKVDPPRTTAAPVTTTIPEITENPVPPATSKSAAEHTHFWSVLSSKEACCAENGIRVYTCSCGQQKEEVLLALPHDYASQGCGNRTRCKNCSAEGDLEKHQFVKNVCSLCSLTVTSPVFVRNTQLNFDEPLDSVIRKLGTPTEILSEGDLKSLVYASDLSSLTIVQTDSVGLWGVFTLDPTAFFYIDGQVISGENFSGKPDSQSDASYLETGSCRVYGFRDKLGTRKYYGMWLRYTECGYHYLTDPRIVQDYKTQEKISYYFVNGLRALNGMTPLQWSEQAAQVSRAYSQKMVDEDFFAHDYLYGNRLNAAGVVWRSCGENVSQGYANAYFVCDAYYNCADHRSNVLSSSFTHVGMGFAIRMDGTYPVSVLGTQTFFS